MVNDRVIVVDPGARGHAIADAYARSPEIRSVVIGPGNTGMIELLRRKHQDVEFILDSSMDIKGPQTVLESARLYKPSLVDVAQDDILALGAVDSLRENGIRAWGPTSSAARIEADKVHSRNLMQRMGIPTPKFMTFDLNEEGELFRAMDSISQFTEGVDGYPIYVKAAGLAAGKGALRANNHDEACEAIGEMLSFGEAGKRFVIEKGLPGREFSAYFMCDGTTPIYLGMAADHKRALDGDLGGQTGGMGVVTPLGISNDQVLVGKLEEIAFKVMQGTKNDGEAFKGILYIGGMLSDEGNIGIVEFNARWGDPEAQVLLPGLQGNYAQLVNAGIDGDLANLGQVEFDALSRVGLTIASRGYPGDYSDVKGREILGVNEVLSGNNVGMFSGGLGYKNGVWSVNGSRNVTVVGGGGTLGEAKKSAYEAASQLSVPMEDGTEGLHFRTDIGLLEERYFR